MAELRECAWGTLALEGEVTDHGTNSRRMRVVTDFPVTSVTRRYLHAVVGRVEGVVTCRPDGEKTFVLIVDPDYSLDEAVDEYLAVFADIVDKTSEKPTDHDHQYNAVAVYSSLGNRDDTWSS